MSRAMDFARRLRRDENGLAFIEFAFAGPIFVVLVLGGLELANLVISHMRVSHMAMTVADNAGRTTSGIDEANIYEVIAGAELIGAPLNFEPNGRVVLSSLEPNGKTGADNGQMIRWQRCWGDLDIDPAYGEQGDGKDDDELIDGLGATGRQIVAAAGTAVMFVEVTYEYQPLLAGDFITPPTMRYETAFNVRGRQNNAITNTKSLVVLDCD